MSSRIAARMSCIAFGDREVHPSPPPGEHSSTRYAVLQGSASSRLPHHVTEDAGQAEVASCVSASTWASAPTNWPISRTTSARGRLIASASRRTIALPTIRPSATGASWRTWSGPLIPKPMQIGKSVWVRSQATFSTRSAGRLLRSPVIPATET